MTRFSWTLAVLLGLLATASAAAFFATKLTAPAVPAAAATSTSLSVVSGTTFPGITFPQLPAPTTRPLEEATSSPAAVAATTSETTPQTPTPTPAKTPPKPEPAPPTTATASATTTATTEAQAPSPLPSSGEASLDATAAALRDALVNIVCYAPAGSGLHSISGSGVIIDSKGIILTNAHVAQYFLLLNKGIACEIRAGSPATDAYTARLLYISPVWLEKNANVLTEAQPTGTGEDDFALLGITGSASKTALPSVFPDIPLATNPPVAGASVVIASFGAQFLSTTQVETALFPTIVFGSVKQVFTFGTNTIDVVDLGGSAAAQEGSSGGGIGTATGTLAGTLTTSTTEGSTDTRSLSAITASYIRGEYAQETATALDLLLAKPIAESVAAFATRIPSLEAVITANLPQS